MGTFSGNTDFEYELAIKQGNVRRLKALAKRKIKPCPVAMLYALTCKRPELLPLLAEAGADPNEPNGYGETPLGRAVKRFEEKVVEQLLRLGADPERESLMTKPLTQAALFGRTKNVRMLLGYGANPNSPQVTGMTALLEAVRYGYAEIVQMLLQHGADPYYRGPDGSDAFAVAKREGRDDLLTLLERTEESLRVLSNDNRLQGSEASGASTTSGVARHAGQRTTRGRKRRRSL